MHFEFGYVDRTVYDPVKKTEFLAAVRDDLAGAIEPEGFSEIRSGEWVRQRTPNVVEVFQFQSLKAGQSFLWGLSLGFVPHVDQRSAIKWHASPKSPQLDLRFDPIDNFSPPSEWVIPLRHGLPSARRLQRHVFKKCWPLAQEFFARTIDLASLLDLFHERASAPTFRFAFESYPQQMLAYAFLLAKAGDLASGQAWLDRYLGPDMLNSSQAGELQRLLAAA